MPLSTRTVERKSLLSLLSAEPLSWNTIFIKNYDVVDPITGKRILCSIVRAEASPPQGMVSIMGLTVCIAETDDKPMRAGSIQSPQQPRRSRSLRRNVSDTADLPPRKKAAGAPASAEISDVEMEAPPPLTAASSAQQLPPPTSTLGSRKRLMTRQRRCERKCSSSRSIRITRSRVLLKGLTRLLRSTISKMSG